MEIIHRYKDPTTYDEQINILKSRGLLINDVEFAKEVLSRVNYYYISGYLYTFRKRDRYGNLKEEYIKNTSFEKVYNIMNFDMKLRSLVLYITDILESHLKAKLGHYSAFKHGPLGYLDSNNFKCQKTHSETKRRFRRQKKYNKNLPFIKHHIQNKDDQIPVWVAIHIFDFGMLNYFYKNMQNPDKKEIAKLFKIRNTVLENWIMYFNYIRNLAAHNMRLYNFRPQYTPKKEKSIKGFYTTMKIFDFFFIARFFVPKDIWNNEIIPQIERLFNAYTKYVDINKIGFSKTWKQDLYL